MLKLPFQLQAAAALLALSGACAAADDIAYPEKPIRFIVTFAPGGGWDAGAARRCACSPRP